MPFCNGILRRFCRGLSSNTLYRIPLWMSSYSKKENQSDPFLRYNARGALQIFCYKDMMKETGYASIRCLKGRGFMELMEAIRARKSYRNEFYNTPVPRSDLREILEAGLADPSG